MNDETQLYNLLTTDPEYQKLLIQIGAKEGAWMVKRGGGNADGLPPGYLKHADPSDRECLLIRSAVKSICELSSRRISGGYPNHYRALAVPFNASTEAIRFSFRYLSRSYHPDTIDKDIKNGAEIVQRFSDIQVEICQATVSLGEEQSRAHYDQQILHARHSISLPVRFWFYSKEIYHELKLKERLPKPPVRTAASPRVETLRYQPRQQIAPEGNNDRQ